MTRFTDAAADLLLGATCPACVSPGWGICSVCWGALDRTARWVDRGLEVPLVAACEYRPLLARIIPRYKDDGALHLSRALGTLLARAVSELQAPPGTLLVPVPSRREAVRARGLDHAKRLARVAAQVSGLKSATVLARARESNHQRGLSRFQRSHNLEHALMVKRHVSPVVVVDDVATSGATLREAVRALTVAGVEVVGAAVIADADQPPRAAQS